MNTPPPFKYKTNWVVVTGAPSSGKTSVIEELAHRGYAIQNEVAREVIEACLKRGLTLESIRNDRKNAQALQKRMLELKLAREMALDTDRLVFMDRGMGDSITYFRLAGLDTLEAEATARIFQYKKVFIFDRLPLKKDNVRTEDDAQADKIDKMLEEDYKALGYDPVRVPVVPVKERADFILQALAG
jgi:predicted ATPase